MEKRFIELLAIRYAKPEPKIIRHYFLMARIAQDCYIRLLKFLFPNVDKLCPDPSKNKYVCISNCKGVGFVLVLCNARKSTAIRAWEMLSPKCK